MDLEQMAATEIVLEIRDATGLTLMQVMRVIDALASVSPQKASALLIVARRNRIQRVNAATRRASR